jgi:hypothetical protein
LQTLSDQVFAAWPADSAAPEVTKVSSMERDGVRMTTFDFESEKPFRLRLFIAHRAGLRLEDLDLLALNVLDTEGWTQFCDTYHSRFGKLVEVFPAVTPDDEAFTQEQKMFAANPWAMAYLCPRGIGPTAWEGSPKAQTQRLRRFYLIGETLPSTQVWDIRRSLQALRQIGGLESTRLWLTAHRDQAANSLLASLFEDDLHRLDLHQLPTTLQGHSLHYFNILKTLDLPQAAALAAERTKLILYTNDEAPWAYPKAVMTTLEKAQNFQIRQVP